jgi:hypothetical protein
MARSRRCEACGINWPHSIAFDECPGCGKYTDSSTEVGLSADPAADLVSYFRQERTAQEAESRRKHEAFERYMAVHDEPIVQELITALDLLPTAEEPQVAS